MQAVMLISPWSLASECFGHVDLTVDMLDLHARLMLTPGLYTGTKGQVSCWNSM